MVLTIIILAVLLILVGLVGTRYYDGEQKIKRAVQEHYDQKNAPYGIAGVQTDSVDRLLWEAVGIVMPGALPEPAPAPPKN